MISILKLDKDIKKLRRKYDDIDNTINKLNYQKLLIQLKLVDKRKQRDLNDDLLDEI